MYRMFKYTKKSLPALALVIALLVLQAICDLKPPAYTAAIVDVGIQQKGIENKTPEILRESTLRELIQWMPGGDAGGGCGIGAVETGAGKSELVEERCADDRMAGGGEAVASPLIDAD